MWFPVFPFLVANCDCETRRTWEATVLRSNTELRLGCVNPLPRPEVARTQNHTTEGMFFAELCSYVISIRSPTCDLTDDRGTDAEQLSVEVAPSLHPPVHGRVEAMVVARGEVDHSVVQPIALSTRGKLRRRVGSKEGPQRVPHA